MRNSLPSNRCQGALTIFLCTLVILVPAVVVGSENAQHDGMSSPPPIEGAKATRNLSIDDIWVVPAAGFKPDGASPNTVFFPFGGGYFQGTSGSYGCMVAPVYLPNGARIMEYFASVYDDDATRSVSVELRRVANFSGGTDLLGSAATTVAGAFAGVQVITDGSIGFPVVAYPDYSYYLTTCLGSSTIRLYSVRIYLDVLFADGFETGNTAAWSVTSP